jgi:hypothetical protein
MVVFPGGWKEIRRCRGGHKTIAWRSCKFSGCYMCGSSWKIFSCYCLDTQPAVFTDRSCANLGFKNPPLLPHLWIIMLR